MTSPKYHGKVYRSKQFGTLFTKTPNGNVLYKHPVVGPFSWAVKFTWSTEQIDTAFKNGYLEVVECGQ